ncbi:MAG: chromosome segregation protein SMC [Candidatus Bathyarchaeia archaeon]
MNFERGFTVITGPNGSGKSNIIDAIRFALGEMSPRALRLEKFSDVINDRVLKDRDPEAIVRLSLDNTDRRIPIDEDLVVISRRVGIDGQSVYRLNKKRVSRSQLMEILGVGGIEPSGVNFIMQGTVTRLADMAPEERRRVLEDLVGISNYEAKKAQAQAELQKADINLRVAEARISEVRSRLENLERERNDALRFAFLKKEADRIKAIITSHRVLENLKETRALESRIEGLRRESEGLSKAKEDLRTKRRDAEERWRRLNEEIVDKGGGRLLEIQGSIGEASARIAALETQLASNKMSLQNLMKLREGRLAHLESLRNSIKEASERLRAMRRERDRALALLSEKKSKHSLISSRLDELRKRLQSGSSQIEAMEARAAELSQAFVKLEAEFRGKEAMLSVVDESLKVARSRQADLGQLMDDLKNRLNELLKMREEEEKNLRQTIDLVNKSLKRKELLEAEMAGALSIAQKAKKAISSFEVQLDLAEKIAIEDLALSKIEEMGKAKAIEGIYGKLQDLIRIPGEYRAALEAAAGGWLKALVVRDMGVARQCAESLKRTRLGRVKIIPLRNMQGITPIEPPSMEGLIGVASSLVKVREEFLPAVMFVFGDTLVTKNADVALSYSRRGYRSVTIDGDLYEAEGSLEGGYYRVPLDLSKLLPKKEQLSSLNEAVAKLEDILKQRDRDIKSVEEEIVRLRAEYQKREGTLRRFQEEASEVSKSMERIDRNLKELDARIRELERQRQINESSRMKDQELREKYMKEMAELEERIKAVRASIGPSIIAKTEAEASELLKAIGQIQEELARIDASMASIEANITSTLKPELERSKTELRGLDLQIKYVNERIEESSKALEEARAQLQEMERMRGDLSKSLSNVKDETRKFQESLSSIDEELRALEERQGALLKEIHDLELQVQAKVLERSFLEEELRRLGYEKPLEVSELQLREAQQLQSKVKSELDSLGSINQLAIAQYAEQKENYKQLSSRLNELEQEKLSILRFIEEIEGQKLQAFLEVYKKVNESLAFFFSELTGGGRCELRLQNPEDPFSGGVDLIAEFPGKGARSISSASGGEKSVTALAFLFAISQIHPAPFYLMDEVDAHLDPFNVERLAELIKESSKGQQFIFVSIKDALLDRAEKVYGVFVQDGISRVVAPLLPPKEEEGLRSVSLA